MPALKVHASIDIAAPASRIRDSLVDFETWPVWSPWLYMEPEATVTYRGSKGVPGHGYDWSGDKTGAGGMTLLKATNVRIDCNLAFLKPFKSQADVAFDLSETTPGNTQVTWHMDSSLPFFMFWMKGTMTGMIRSDYNRGLRLFKDYIEHGSIGSTTEIMNMVSVEPQPYVGVQASSSMESIAESMGITFASAISEAQSSSISITGSPFCIYNYMDIKQGRCKYTAALPVGELTVASSPLMSSVRPACTALKVVHTGPYHHLGNAWGTLMAEARQRKLKALKKVPPFEVYLGDTEMTVAADLVTEIYLPVQ